MTDTGDMSVAGHAPTVDEPARDPLAAGGTADELIIQPRRGWIAVDWRELWRHRELLFFLVWRDVKVRYQQAVLGVMWAVIAPVINVALFTLIFGRGFGSSVVYDRFGHSVPL